MAVPYPTFGMLDPNAGRFIQPDPEAPGAGLLDPRMMWPGERQPSGGVMGQPGMPNMGPPLGMPEGISPGLLGMPPGPQRMPPGPQSAAPPTDISAQAATTPVGPATPPPPAPPPGGGGGLGRFFDPNNPMTANLPIQSMLGFGMGMLSGSDRASGWGGALKGMQAGMPLDMEQRKQRLQQAALSGMYGGGGGPGGPAGAAGGAGGPGTAGPGGGGPGGGRYAALAAAFPDKAAAAMFERLKPQNLSPGNTIWVDRGDGVPVQVAAAPHKPEMVTTQGPGGETTQHYSQPPSGPMTGNIPVVQAGGGGGAAPLSIGPGAIKGLEGTQEAYTKRAATYLEGHDKGSQMLGSLRVLENQMDDPNFYSGIGSGVNQTARKALVAIGVDPKLAASAETFGAVSKKLVLDTLGSLGTGISNADRETIMGTVANIENTPEGNKRLIAIQRSLAERQVAVANQVAEYQDRVGRFDARGQLALSKWMAENPFEIPEAVQPEKQRQSVVPEKFQKLSPEKQLQAAPNGTRAVINGVPSIKKKGFFVPLNPPAPPSTEGPYT